VIGLTAGASTPESLVLDTIAALGELGYRNVEELRTAEEDVVFPLPRELRSGQLRAGTRTRRVEI